MRIITKTVLLTICDGDRWTVFLLHRMMYVFGGFNSLLLSDLLIYTSPSCAAFETLHTCNQAAPGIQCVWNSTQGVCLPWEGSSSGLDLQQIPASCSTRSCRSTRRFLFLYIWSEVWWDGSSLTDTVVTVCLCASVTVRGWGSEGHITQVLFHLPLRIVLLFAFCHLSPENHDFLQMLALIFFLLLSSTQTQTRADGICSSEYL